jgi:RecQ family ATP-dependent DNA helicase
LEGKDVFVVMPNIDRSLCYQLAGMISRGVTVVISLHRSLIDFQLQKLKQIGINAGQCTGTISSQEYQVIRDGMHKGTLRFVYITPEKLAMTERFQSDLNYIHQLGHLRRFVIEDVHCVSQWSRGFRPEYARFGELKTRFPNIPVMVLSGVATSGVKMDVKRILRISECVTCQQRFHRANLFYEVRTKPKDIGKQVDDMIEWIQGHGYEGKSGMIFTAFVNDTQRIECEMRRRIPHMKCCRYHDEMSESERKRVESLWKCGSIQVIITTMSLGIENDRLDVRYVIHHTMCKSIEEYYEESGEAGKDGGDSHCMLLYDEEDANKLWSLLLSCEDDYEDQETNFRDMGKGLV